MNIERTLRIGDVSDNGQVTIVDEDRLCYLVKSESRGSVGLRTISKSLLDEYVHYFAEHPDSNANAARDALCGKTEIDKFEYGYTSTLTVMAKMVLEHENIQNENNNRKEIVREKFAATFLKKIMHFTLSQDANFSNLEAINRYEKTSKRLRLNGFAIGCDKNQLPTRTDDYDINIAWEYGSQEYVLYLEFAPKDMEQSFFPAYNEAYNGLFNIVKEANGDYVLYQIGKTNKEYINQNQIFQQIFYGAPGTGKSNTIKKLVDEQNKKCHRTTFHPDSDYSTFVGAYKPTMKSSERIYSPEELTVKLKEIKTTGTTYPCHKFAAKYWESLKDLTPDSIKQILNACGFTDNYSVELGKGVAIGQECLNKPEDGKIIYTFCPQAFTNAYVEAWNTEEDVFLIIEEINRGNCAQIFGDLFQLLDRKNGVSEYPVEADADLQSYLFKALADTTRTDIPEDVKSGKKLKLPSNLYIWATMNTSDQSLFPIDSAFKRRWEWKYIKIREGKDENGNKLDWKVDVKIDEENNLLSWWAFVQKINEIIASMTSSADKQLGYFFCCAKNGVIDEETFVSKVIFYLWNDVFKDYGFEDASLFRYIAKDEDGKETEKDLTFPDFYDEDGEKVNTDRLTDFLKKVMSWRSDNKRDDDK